MRLAYLLLMCLISLSDPLPTDDFIPKDIIHSVAIGCMVAGVHDNPPYAETQVFVKWSKDGTKGWDFRPIMSRRTVDQGGELKAIDDCIDWYKSVRATLAKAAASKQP